MANDGTVKIGTELDDSGFKSGVSKLGDTAKTAFKSAATVIGGITTAATGAAAGIMALADSTAEYRTEQAKLNSAYDAAGYSADVAQEAYRGFYSILGESDTAVEASQLLAQLAQSEEDVAKYVDIAAGVYGTFGDALPIESLIEAANETAKTGEITGQLADALKWVSINQDDFQASLDECSTEQERAAKITETLSELYDDAADSFKEGNKSIIEANEANAEFTDALADLGEAVTPLTTTFKKGFANILSSVNSPALKSALNNLDNSFEDMFESLGEIAQDVAPIFVEVIGFAARNIKDLAIVVPSAVIAFKSLVTVLDAAKASQIGFTAALAANPLTAIVGGISALVGAFGLLSIAVNETKYADEELMELEARYAEAQELQSAVEARITAYNDLKDAAISATDSDAAQIERVQSLADELLSLADSTGKVQEADESRAQFILGQLNEALGTEYQLTGQQIQNYSDLTNSIYDMLDAKKAEILLSGQEQIYADAVAGLKDTRTEYEQLSETFKTANIDYKNAQAAYYAAEAQFQHGLDTATGAELQRLAIERNNAQERLNIAEETYNALELAMQENLVQQESYNRDIATYEQMYVSLLEGNTEQAIALYEGRDAAVLESEQTLEDATIHRKQQLEQQLLDQAETLEKMRQELEAGNKEIKEEDLQAAEELFKQTYEEYKQIGAAVPTAWAEGSGDNEYLVEDATQNVVDTAKDTIDNADFENKGYISGGLLSSGVAKGINSKAYLVSGAAQVIINKANEAMRAAAQIHSPSRLMANEVGAPLSQGVAVGIKKDAHLIEEEASAAINNAAKELEKSMPTVTMDIAAATSSMIPTATTRNIIAFESGVSSATANNGVITELRAILSAIKEGQVMVVDKQVLAKVTKGTTKNNSRAVGVSAY